MKVTQLPYIPPARKSGRFPEREYRSLGNGCYQKGSNYIAFDNKERMESIPDDRSLLFNEEDREEILTHMGLSLIRFGKVKIDK